MDVISPKGPNSKGKITNYIEVEDENKQTTVQDFLKQHAMGMVDDYEPLLSKQISYLSNESSISSEIKKMTGYATMMQGKALTGVNALESRTLRERLARHRALTDLLNPA